MSKTIYIKPGESLRFDSWAYPGKYVIWEYEEEDVLRCTFTNDNRWRVGDSRVNGFNPDDQFTVIPGKSQNFNNLYEKLSYGGD